MDRLERVKAIVQQYANKGEIFLEESYAKGEHAYTTGYWDGYADCAKTLLKEIDSMQGEPKEFKPVRKKQPEGVLKELLDNMDKKELEETRKEMLEEEPVSEELEEAAQEYSFNIPTQCEADVVWKNETEMHFYDGAIWQKENMLKDAIEFTFDKSLPAVIDCKLRAMDIQYGDRLIIIKSEKAL